MRVLLVNPPSPLKERFFITPPLGLMYLASVLRLNGHQVKILDLFSLGEGVERASDVLKKEVFDIVGITGMSFQHNPMLKVAEVVKNEHEEIKVIAGGSHASAVPSLLLENKNVDFVLRGEADCTLSSLLNVIDNSMAWKNVRGLCFKTKEGFHISPPEIVSDVDSIPFPAWDFIDVKKYAGHHHGFFYEKEPIGQIITSRGCPYRCTFCAASIVHSRVWRPHSPKRVISEIDRLVKDVGIRELHIEDDNFTLNLQRVKKIFEEIVRRKYNLTISLPNGVRIDRLDDEILKLMKKAGVYSITFGVESGSSRILERMKKNITLELVEKQVKKTKKYGFYTQAFFIIGFPYEEKKDIEETIKFALKLDLDAAFFGTYVPLPGSQDFEELVEKGKITVERMDWDHMFSSKAQESSFYLTPQEIEYFQRLATRKFYIRPRIFLKSLGRIHGFRHVHCLLTRIRAVC